MTSCFGKNTDGFGTGIELESGTFRDMTIGNLAGRGIAHFFSKEELYDLLKKTGFIDIQIDTILRTDRDMKIEEYIATARKPK